jgi:hypothetical protein
MSYLKPFPEGIKFNKVHIAGRGLVVRQLPPIGRGSFRSSVSFGQERSPKSAPTTCTNR